MQVNHILSDLDVALIEEGLGLLPLGRAKELYARLTVSHAQANQQAMQELQAARTPKPEPAAETPAPPAAPKPVRKRR